MEMSDRLHGFRADQNRRFAVDASPGQNHFRTVFRSAAPRNNIIKGKRIRDNPQSRIIQNHPQMRGCRTAVNKYGTTSLQKQSRPACQSLFFPCKPLHSQEKRISRVHSPVQFFDSAVYPPHFAQIRQAFETAPNRCSAHTETFHCVTGGKHMFRIQQLQYFPVCILFHKIESFRSSFSVQYFVFSENQQIMTICSQELII